MSFTGMGRVHFGYNAPIYQKRINPSQQTETENIRKISNETKRIAMETEEIKELGHKIETPDFYGANKK